MKKFLYLLTKLLKKDENGNLVIKKENVENFYTLIQLELGGSSNPQTP